MRNWIVVFFVFLANNLYAESSFKEVESKVSKIESQNLKSTGLQEFHDDIASPQVLEDMKLTEAEIYESKVWGLSENEEKRYVLLMKNKSKTYYQGLNLTPVDILGLNARNMQERQYFARIAAAQEAQKLAQNIAWNIAFHEASKELTEGVPVIGDFDKRPFSPHAYKPIFIHAGDVLNFFVEIDNPVKTIMAELISAIEINPGTSLNIFIVGGDTFEIQQWANSHSIPQTLVQNGRITLNQGGQQFLSLGVDKSALPKLVLVREGSASFVNLEKF